jgi:hypothetical protein
MAIGTCVSNGDELVNYIHPILLMVLIEFLPPTNNR